jgi:hypothetical protein
VPRTSHESSAKLDGGCRIPPGKPEQQRIAATREEKDHSDRLRRSPLPLRRRRAHLGAVGVRPAKRGKRAPELAADGARPSLSFDRRSTSGTFVSGNPGRWQWIVRDCWQRERAVRAGLNQRSLFGRSLSELARRSSPGRAAGLVG